MIKRILIIGLVPALLTLLGCSKAPDTRATAVAASASTNTYASLGALPDWSGAWISYSIAHNRLRSVEEEHDRPPLKDPAKMAKFLETQAINNAGGDNTTPARRALEGNLGGAATGIGGPGTARFFGRTGGGPAAMMEFLFTPGRVTILTDGGTVRRIYTAGQEIPKDYPTAMGFSTGHWEGKTLVVHTTNLDPQTRLRAVGEASEGFTIDERIYLKQADVLEIDATITAPELFSEPYHLPPQVFQKMAFKPELLQDYLGETATHDRSVAAGGQQFDLAPPTDIPPPPVVK
jgi:hypothetical protein